MDLISRDDLTLAITWLHSHPATDPELGQPYPTRLPYDAYPGQTPDGLIDLTTRDAWNWYRWNPPEYLDYTEHQADCMAKPTWDMIIGALVSVRQEQAIDRLDSVCTARITAGYGEQNEKAELHFRLRATESGASNADKIRQADGNTERDRLRARYQAITAWINTITDPDILRNLDFSDDEYWSATWSPPDPAG